MNDAVLKVVTVYTGKETLEEALKEGAAKKLLWLEILFNDGVEWERYLAIKDVKDAYEKACIWYGKFRSLIEAQTKRKPLQKKNGEVDYREYRRFIEVLNFVSR